MSMEKDLKELVDKTEINVKCPIHPKCVLCSFCCICGHSLCFNCVREHTHEQIIAINEVPENAFKSINSAKNPNEKASVSAE